MRGRNDGHQLPYSILAPAAVSLVSIAAISPPVVSFATAIGTFFAPNTAAAAGGAANVIAASATGSLFTFIPGTIGIVIAGLMLLTGFNLGNAKLINAAILLGIVDIVATFLFAAKIGAGIAGTATSSILLINTIGGAVILMGAALAVCGVIAAGAACLSTVAAAFNNGPLR